MTRQRGNVWTRGYLDQWSDHSLDPLVSGSAVIIPQCLHLHQHLLSFYHPINHPWHQQLINTKSLSRECLYSGPVIGPQSSYIYLLPILSLATLSIDWLAVVSTSGQPAQEDQCSTFQKMLKSKYLRKANSQKCDSCRCVEIYQESKLAKIYDNCNRSCEIIRRASLQPQRWISWGSVQNLPLQPSS